MNDENTCECGTPVMDSFICGDCLRDATAAIEDLNRYWTPLTQAHVNDARLGSGGARDSLSPPMPWNETSRRVMDDVMDTLSRYGWLLVEPERLRNYEFASEVHRRVRRLAERSERAVDRPEPLAFAGACAECEAPLFAQPGAIEVTCVPCDLTYDVAGSREYFLSRLDDQLVNAAVISTALTSVGQPVTVATVQRWSERGRLVARGMDRKGMPLYRVGDARDVLAQINFKNRNVA